MRNTFKTHVAHGTWANLVEKQWKGHNVDLQRLAQTIENYYSRRNLKAKVTAFRNGYSIRVVVMGLRTQRVMSIIIRGAPDDFTIETRATESEDNTLKLGLLTTVFGGGSLVLGSVKAREELEKLEREFWRTIEETIGSLSNLMESPR
jgi:hypothetical protein